MTKDLHTGSEKLHEARDIIIEAFGHSFALYGLSDVIGRIYGLLYFSEDPMGLDAIAEGLGVSKATVSINIRVLEGLKFVRKVWQKGSRRDFYEAQRNFSKIFTELLKTNMKKELELTREAINKSQSVLAEVINSAGVDEETKAKAQIDNQRLQELEKQYKTYWRLAELMGAGEKFWNMITFKKNEE